MSQEDGDRHLSQISTFWSIINQAHQGDPDAAREAQRRVLERYASSIYRYLFRVLRDPDAADEVFQQFAFHLVRGGFRNADPERGKFRNYLKISLLRMVSHYRQGLRKDRLQFAEDVVAVEEPVEVEPESDREFIESCRDELLSRAWSALEALQQRTGQPYHTALDWRTANPDGTSEVMAAELTARLGPDQPFNAAGARKILQRAREKFSELLLDEVAQTLHDPSRDDLEQELIELGLWPYCRTAFEKRFGA